MEMELTTLIINLSDLLAKFLLPILMILHFVSLEVLVLEGEMLPPGDIQYPFKLEVEIPAYFSVQFSRSVMSNSL